MHAKISFGLGPMQNEPAVQFQVIAPDKGVAGYQQGLVFNSKGSIFGQSWGTIKEE